MVIKMPEFKKIDEIISQRKLLPRNCEYHTWRDAKNSKGEKTGKIRILVIKGEKIAHSEYKCPECGYVGYGQSEWKRPFYLRCIKCGYRISVPRMRDEFKREQKEEKRKAEHAN